MALLILRESNNTTRYTSKRPNPRHRPCFATPRSGPHHDATPKQFPSAAVGQHHDAAPGQHLGTVPGQHPGAAAEQYPGAASSQPRPQIHPRSASGPQRPNTVSGSTPVPHRAHNIPALPRGPSQEPRNKKSVRSPQQGKSRENARSIITSNPKSETKKAPAMRTPQEKPIRLKSTLPWHHTARNKHRVQPSTYRRSPLHPELRGCTGAR